MKWTLVLLSLAILFESIQGQTVVESLTNYKTDYVNQVEQQVAKTRSVISTKRISEFGKYVIDIGEAIKFADDEINRLATLLVDLNEQCIANLPATPQSIRTSANDLIGKCVDLVRTNAPGEDVDRQYANFLDNFRSNARDTNLLFTREFFKNPMELMTFSFYMSTSDWISAKAVQWDNIDSMDLYDLRATAHASFEPIGPALDTCIMDFKEFIATEYGRVFLYLWECEE